MPCGPLFSVGAVVGASGSWGAATVSGDDDGWDRSTFDCASYANRIIIIAARKISAV